MLQDYDFNISNIINCYYTYRSKIISVTFRSLLYVRCNCDFESTLIRKSSFTLSFRYLIRRWYFQRILRRPTTATVMQNFDDLDIEGRSPSHLPEEDKEKVKERCHDTGRARTISISRHVLFICDLDNWKVNEYKSSNVYTRSRIDRNRAVYSNAYPRCEVYWFSILLK